MKSKFCGEVWIAKFIKRCPHYNRIMALKFENRWDLMFRYEVVTPLECKYLSMILIIHISLKVNYWKPWCNHHYWIYNHLDSMNNHLTPNLCPPSVSLCSQCTFVFFSTTITFKFHLHQISIHYHLSLSPNHHWQEFDD